MMKSIGISLPFVFIIVLAFAASQVHAAADYYLKVGDIKGESEAKSGAEVSAASRAEAGATSSVESERDTSERGNEKSQSDSKKGGNVETQWKVEEGEKGSAKPGVEREMKESGEKGGTQDINIGVGELKGVSVRAVEVRGWDAKQKAEFMAAVKTHAQVRSGQDLENFAKGILVDDENVEELSSDEDSVEVRYRVPAKFLGIFDASLPATVVAEKSSGQGESKGTVKVKFPWFRLLYSVPEVAAEWAIEAELDAELASELTAGELDARAQASLYAKIVAALKVRAASAASEEAETDTD